MNFDKNKFWENKIVGWENRSYLGNEVKTAPKSNINRVFGTPLQFRLSQSAKILSPYVSGKKLLELGCGGGLLFKALSGTKIEKYTGIDWASSAIDKADSESHNSFQSIPSEFINGNFMDMEFPEFDVVVALGVLDWLELDEINILFSKIKHKKFLFSISEKRISIKRWFHSIYVFFLYGWKNKGYVPKYYTTDEIIRIACNHGYTDVKIFRDPRMSFGTLLYKLN